MAKGEESRVLFSRKKLPPHPLLFSSSWEGDLMAGAPAATLDYEVEILY